MYFQIEDYFKNANNQLTSKEYQRLNILRDKLNTFQTKKEQYDFINKRRQIAKYRREDQYFFGIDVNDTLNPNENSQTRIPYRKEFNEINQINKLFELLYPDLSNKSNSDAQNNEADGFNNRYKRDEDGNVIYDQNGNPVFKSELELKQEEIAKHAEAVLKIQDKIKTIQFIAANFKAICLVIGVIVLVIIAIIIGIYMSGVASSMGHTPFMLCGEDSGSGTIELEAGTLEEMSKPEYAQKAFIKVAKEHNWTDNAIIGTLSYIMQEGSGMGTFSYEAYYCVEGPGGQLVDKTLDNQKWLKWIQSLDTLDVYNRVYYGANTGRYAAIGLGLTQQSDVYNTRGGAPEATNATKMIEKAIEDNKPWQDPLWQCGYIIDNIFTSPGVLNDSDYLDPTTYTGSAKEYCARVTTFIGMPGYNWNDGSSFIADHTRHIDAAANVYSSFTGADIDSIDGSSTVANNCDVLNGSNSIGNATIAEAAVSLASGFDKIQTLKMQHNYDDPELNDPRLALYKRIHIAIFPSDYYFASCDRSSATAIRWSGADINFPAGGTGKQATYLASSEKWKRVGIYGECELQPGDVLMKNPDGHIKIYVGTDAIKKRFPEATNEDMYAGSLAQGAIGHFPRLYKDDPSYDSEYIVYRNVKPDNSNKYKNL